jgi:chlorite dismutase
MTQHAHGTSENKQPGLPQVDVNEYGGKKDGTRQSMNRRLFMQLVVFDLPAMADVGARTRELGEALRAGGVASVVYDDLMDPRGVGLLTWSEDPAHFVQKVRPLFSGLLRDTTMRNDFGMLGRTYASGYEPELEHWLLRRPVEHVLDPSFPWHVWYPLRRTGAFAKLPQEEQNAILREHGQIGLAYGQSGLATDVRLACHGLDADDNEFVIGLVGKELHPLSHLVQRMRTTRQTSEFISKMGPFFVGHVAARTGT